MGDEESVYEVHTPTRSELATFQVLANQDFVNLLRVPEPVEEEVLDSVSVHIVDDDEELTPHVIPREIEQSAPPADAPFEDHEEELPSPKSYKSASPRASFRPTNSYRPPPPPVEKPKPSRYKEAAQAEIEAEKEGLLSELHNLERQGAAKLVRPLSMDDSLEEIQFQYDRIQAEINANQMVDFAKSSIKMGSGMVEMLMKKAGIKVVDGYHNNLCKDMNKFNRPLNRLYKKYWRRGGMSPEAELGMLVLGSLAWTVVQNKMGSATAAFSGNSDAPPPPQEPRSPQPQAPSRPTMKPPQMSSLNIPASWSSPQPEANDSIAKSAQLMKEAEEKIKKLDEARAEMEEREQSMKRFAASLEARSEFLERKIAEREDMEERILELESKNEEEDKEPKKVVMLQGATPKKSSSRKKSVAIDLN